MTKKKYHAICFMQNIEVIEKSIFDALYSLHGKVSEKE